METIAILDASILLFLKKEGDGTAPELTDFLEARGIRTTANYLALALRNLEAKGLVELIGSRRRSRGGAAANLWALTPAGNKEAAEVIGLFGGLMGVEGKKRK